MQNTERMTISNAAKAPEVSKQESARPDYYEILGVSKGATLEEIRNAYRSAALRYHPDRAPPQEKKQAEEQFKRISEAYAILSDPQKRALYDQYGHGGIDQRYAYEDIFRDTDFGSVFEGMSDFGMGEGLFDRIFGDLGFDIFGRQGRKGARTGRGRDLQVTLEIDLEEAITGVDKKITFHRYDTCTSCGGSGALKEGKAPCPECRGSGQRISTSGHIRMIQTCTRCGGEGTVIREPCPTCGGEGRVRLTKTLVVTVPPGIDTGMHLRVKGEGEAGSGGRGNLDVIVVVRPHPHFEREGSILILSQRIPLTTAILGGEVEIPLPAGKKVMMKIPPGTQNGMTFRLQGKGMPHLQGSGSGPLLVKIAVNIPEKLTAEQKRLMKEFEKTLQYERLEN